MSYTYERDLPWLRSVLWQRSSLPGGTVCIFASIINIIIIVVQPFGTNFKARKGETGLWFWGHSQSQCCSGWGRSWWGRRASCATLSSRPYLQGGDNEARSSSRTNTAVGQKEGEGEEEGGEEEKEEEEGGRAGRWVCDSRSLLMTGRWLPWSFRYAALKPSRETRIRGGLEKLSGHSERKENNFLLCFFYVH